MQQTQNGNVRMQWFILILIPLWILVATVFTIVAFCLTQNPQFLWGFGTLVPPGYIMHRITCHIFPKDDRDYKLAEAKAKYKAQERHNKKRAP